ncbi:MAG: c-type cytochrome [Anaerolineales bacterium]|nr:c-type cytochrome [Anaerolineales bacterium]
MKGFRLVRHAYWLILVVLVVLVQQVSAGGWVVVTVSSLPQTITAGEPFAVQFAMRGHGRELLSEIPVRVTAVHTDTGETVTVTAVDAPEAGFYDATIALPLAGQWEWKIQTWMDYPMPPLWANEVSAVSLLSTGASSAISVPVQARILLVGGSVGAIVAFVLWLRRRTYWRLGLVLVGIVIAVWGMAAGETAVAQTELVEQRSAIAEQDLGEALFVAKGCITCHRHDGVTMADNLAQIGPDLTNYKGNAGYLMQWLDNPADLKPKTQMPRLGLSEDEIGILVNFLSE